MAMPAKTEEVMAVRQEMWSLLREQLEDLNSPNGLTDDQLLNCYYRQTRVLELREKLEAASEAERELGSNINCENVDEMPATNSLSSRSQSDCNDSLIIAA
jgi:hypothetical protein